MKYSQKLWQPNLVTAPEMLPSSIQNLNRFSFIFEKNITSFMHTEYKLQKQTADKQPSIRH